MFTRLRTCCCFWTALLASSPATAAPPRTPVSPVIETYHGTRVVDPYRWLEDGRSPQVQAWTQAQNAHARRILDRLPGVAKLRAEIVNVLTTNTVHYDHLQRAAGRWFCWRTRPQQQQPSLIVMDDLDQPALAHVVVDPNQIDASGQTAMDWYRVAPDGRLVAVSLSVGGSELGTLRIYETATGQQVFESLAGVNSGTAGGSLAWSHAGDGFYYTRHLPLDPTQPTDARVYQHVYYHALGTDPAADRFEFGQDLPRIAEIQLASDPSSDRLLATVQNGDGGQFAHFLRDSHGSWHALSTFADGIAQVVFGRGGQLYWVNCQTAPRGEVWELSASAVGEQAWDRTTRLIPQSDATIVTGGAAFWGLATLLSTEQRFYVTYQLGGPTEIRAFDHHGRPLPTPPQLSIAAVSDIMAAGEDDVVFANTSFLQPPGYYRFDARTGQTLPTALRTTSPVATPDWTVLRRFARSADGTQIPLSIILRKDTVADGNNPCIVTGYGGYGISSEPDFQAIRDLWLRRGAIFVVTHLRGGGEYGAAWHRAGKLTRKQNVFDDFAACLQYLVEEQYTRPSRIGIVGGSNGGLLMGAMLTQFPDRFKAAVAYVGIYDLLRVEFSPNGAFNVPEFGSVANPAEFRALYGYSPYHRVVEGVRYPPILFVTGANDPRVDPLQSRKMTARLQAATNNRVPILLRTSAGAGHGSNHSLSEQVEQTVDATAFLMEQLGVRP